LFDNAGDQVDKMAARDSKADAISYNTDDRRMGSSGLIRV
jgi:hypothetical protein